MDRRIAVVGWGSLIWDPRELPLASSWHPDGPQLPVEFARVSDDGRLTLVLRDGVADAQTLWALMSSGALDEAREQLARRERTVPDLIGSLEKGGPPEGPVASWLAQRQLDAVVWTGLPSNFEERTGEPLSVDAAVRYLEQVSDDTRLAAERYVRRAPPQVRTAIRRGLERRLGWTTAYAQRRPAP